MRSAVARGVAWLVEQTDAGRHFPATPIALKMVIALLIGMPVGMEREWSNKDVGVRSFAIVALLGMLAAVIGVNVAIASLDWRAATGRRDERTEYSGETARRAAGTEIDPHWERCFPLGPPTLAVEDHVVRGVNLALPFTSSSKPSSHTFPCGRLAHRGIRLREP